MPDDSKSLLHTTLPLPSKIHQINGLQIIRAIAVALVAWLHAGQDLVPVTKEILPEFGAFGVDIFFVISGFIMSLILLRSRHEASGLRATWEFLKRRLIRIFPIYWLFCLIIALRLLRNRSFFQQNYLPSIFLLPFGHQPTPALVSFSWTLVFEIFFYLSLSVILMFFSARRAVLVSIVSFCSAILLGEVAGTQHPFWIIGCNPMLLEFVFGALLALAHQRLGRMRGFGIALLLLGVAEALYLRAFPDQGGANGMQMVLAGVQVIRRVTTWGLSAAMIVGGIIFWSPVITKKLGRIVVILGNASYSTYLASALLIEFTMRLILKIRGEATMSTPEHVAYQTLIVFAVFAGGWLCYQFIEWPMIRKLQGMV
ncbi:acyltransferase [Granulicella sp. S190]|uniref:acyltransferase family protein n=1 Tax=Granulicella sp. S190 TaxID=1747226 RepID=UPI00131BB1F5|nr:acyltransferase [Granulicella sp. S190]